LLKVAIENMLKLSKEENKTFDSNLTIIENLLSDHPKLISHLVPILAYDILTFLQGANITEPRLIEFHRKVIKPNAKIFTQALQTQIMSEDAITDVSVAKDTVRTIDYYYALPSQIELLLKPRNIKEELLK
jgi:anaerobic C4-dicarboxylate transporter